MAGLLCPMRRDTATTCALLTISNERGYAVRRECGWTGDRLAAGRVPNTRTKAALIQGEHEVPWRLRAVGFQLRDQIHWQIDPARAGLRLRGGEFSCDGLSLAPHQDATTGQIQVIQRRPSSSPNRTPVLKRNMTAVR
jgi:hypothetical protein